MRALRFLLQKEFRQIFRNKALLPMIFIMPIIQLLVMPLAADFEVKNINIAIVDHDRSGSSAKLISKITAGGYFRLIHYGSTFKNAFEILEDNKADLILEIPNNFENNLLNENHEKLFLAINAINGTKASLGGQYLGKIIGEYNSELRLNWLKFQSRAAGPVIEVANSNWYNPFLNYPSFMVPGILVTLVTMVGVYMCSLNIVKEKEVGTIEQINVTPIKKYEFILGKLIPFWVIGVFVFTIGLFVIARFAYGIIPVGNIPLLYSFLAIYLIAILGIGLLISTYSETQQQAMSLAFFCMMVFLLMSGLFTSVDSMPAWAKWIAQFNPVTYFIEVMRMVVLKGSGLQDIKQHFIKMFAFAIFFNGWAILNYKKTN